MSSTVKLLGITVGVILVLTILVLLPTGKTKNEELIAENGDTILVNYTGKLEDGTVFDSSYERNQAFNFTLGAGEVIKGWDEGILGMKKGEKKQLVIPPEKGYGNQDKGSIPPNSTLIFDIEIVDIIKK